MDKKSRLLNLQEKVSTACQKAGRDLSSIKIVAVSKTKPWEDVRDFFDLGLIDFGENYLQEALPKREQLEHSGRVAQWHFIGALQSNKAKFIPGNFSLLHSLNSLSAAEKIHKAALERNLVQDCLVQVNVQNESTKSGVLAKDLQKFLDQLNPLSALRVTGLMCIPEVENSTPAFQKLRQLRDRSSCKMPLKELSMGMSGDFESAIGEGATLIRIGTTLFGERP